MNARRALVAVLALALLSPAGCAKKEPAKGEARLEVDGTALVERRDGTEEEVSGKTDLRAGDRVELRRGTGTMVLRGGVRMELRSGAGEAGNSAVKMGTTPVLEAGDLLVTSPGRTEVSAAGTVLTVDTGAAQVSRMLGMGVAAYDGVVHVDSAGVTREVRALREMQVPALGQPPTTARPLDYRANDPWDRRFLGSAIDLGRRLQTIANGYTSNLARGEGRTPGFFRAVLPGLDDESDFGAQLIDPAKPPGETLIGAAITELGRRGTFANRWSSVFGFRDEGAEWGLVALDQGVSGTPLLGAIEQAVGSSPLLYAAPGASRVPGGSSSPTTSPGGGPRTPTTTAPPPPTPTTSPPTTQPPGPLDPLLDVVPDPAGDVVSGLVGGLLDTP